MNTDGRGPEGPAFNRRGMNVRRANFPKCVFFFLSPRRRSGERIEERGDPSPKRPRYLLSPPLHGGEGACGCGSVALRRIADCQSALLRSPLPLQRFNALTL